MRRDETRESESSPTMRKGPTRYSRLSQELSESSMRSIVFLMSEFVPQELRQLSNEQLLLIVGAGHVGEMIAPSALVLAQAVPDVAEILTEVWRLSENYGYRAAKSSLSKDGSSWTSSLSSTSS